MHLSLCLLTPQSIFFATAGVSQLQYIKISRYWDLLECISQGNHTHFAQWKKTKLANGGSYVPIPIRLIHSEIDISNESKVGAVKMAN